LYFQIPNIGKSGTRTPWLKRIFTQQRVLRGLQTHIPRRLRLGRDQRRGTILKIRPQRLRLPSFQIKRGRELSFPEKHKTHRPCRDFAQRFCTGARSSQRYDTKGGIILNQNSHFNGVRRGEVRNLGQAKYAFIFDILPIRSTRIMFGKVKGVSKMEHSELVAALK